MPHGENLLELITTKGQVCVQAHVDGNKANQTTYVTGVFVEEGEGDHSGHDIQALNCDNGVNITDHTECSQFTVGVGKCSTGVRINNQPDGNSPDSNWVHLYGRGADGPSLKIESGSGNTSTWTTLARETTSGNAIEQGDGSLRVSGIIRAIDGDLLNITGGSDFIAENLRLQGDGDITVDGVDRFILRDTTIDAAPNVGQMVVGNTTPQIEWYWTVSITHGTHRILPA